MNIYAYLGSYVSAIGWLKQNPAGKPFITGFNIIDLSHQPNRECIWFSEVIVTQRRFYQ